MTNVSAAAAASVLCRFDAIEPTDDSSEEDLVRKIAEYAKAVCQGRPNFHINIVMDVSPYCDCHAENDTPVIQDIGMFASFDPVALDQACIDAVNAANPLPGSLLTDRIAEDGDTHDHFHTIFRNTHWQGRPGARRAHRPGHYLVRIGGAFVTPAFRPG